eukprot:CAMPEP_0114626304 /NCGR_PEP_ID=MMETSP0168-20121206/11712_1 /TAXON_ID=95228 ORGANISM="Vannella sp., Strain DIVA3 517/6/12" /NCGR_SAMPLE_ID=MMETSP0168 /ASSEMBLY_ACC=CAM_ASM_000044 /LENGTH=463 /DNA_ID=CAMNT_0001837603 /DNA_START=137 /DNA_END=1528 /DNA_ORIENTATION=+
MSIPRPDSIDDDEAFLSGRVEAVAFSPKTLSLEEINEQARIQQELVFSNEETIRQSYRKLECGKQTINEFQATLVGLGLRETRALRKVLRETANGATATYSKFIKALTMPDSTDPSEAHNDPASSGRRVSAAPPTRNTIPTLEDEYIALTQPRTPSKQVRPEYATDSDVLTWSTPEKARERAAGKGRIGSADRMAATDVIPTFSPPPSPFSPAPSGAAPAQALSPASAQNQLIQSFLGDSISGAEFRRHLEEAGIGTSERLEKIIENKERGARARFTDIKQELAFLQSNPQFQRSNRSKPAKSVHSATVDIFDMERTAPQASTARNAPHSKEQCDDLRRQQDVLTWVDSPEKAFVPGKRVGCHDQRRDVIKWAEEGAASAAPMRTSPGVAGGPAAPSPSRAPKVGGKANVTSGDIFSWGNPEQEPPRRMRAQAPASSVPWGTVEDMHSNINPHLANLTKRVPK